MGYFDVLALPLVTFWSFNRQVSRIKAENEQRQLRVIIAGSSTNPEAAKQLADTLASEIGMTSLIEKSFDEEKFAELQKKLSRSSVSNDTHAE